MALMLQDSHCGQECQPLDPLDMKHQGQTICEAVCQVSSQVQVPSDTQL